MTTIAILGTGNMGKGLAGRLNGKADIVIGSRSPAAGQLSSADAAAKADIVVLALPYDAALEAAKSLNLAGKVVVDMTNAVTSDFSGLRLGYTTSAAEEIQKVAPAAKVVKAYNTIFAGLFAVPAAQTAKVPVFIAGNDDGAVAAVTDLVTASGFAPEKTGGLDAARLVEPVGMLNIKLAFGLGHGPGIAPAWLKVA